MLLGAATRERQIFRRGEDIQDLIRPTRADQPLPLRLRHDEIAGSRLNLETDLGKASCGAGHVQRRRHKDDAMGSVGVEKEFALHSILVSVARLGLDPNGMWTLQIVDTFTTADGGKLNSWSITLTKPGGETMTLTGPNGDAVSERVCR